MLMLSFHSFFRDVFSERSSLDVKKHHRRANGSQGFTLIEMAIVLIILTLVVGSALVPLGAQIEQRQRAETQRTLDEIKEALIGYTLANGVLPCPSDVSGGIPTGVVPSVPCTTGIIATGYIPWVTLGVNNHDAWGNLIRYAVDTKFTTAFTLQTVASITIQSRNTAGALTTISATIPAAVFSLGKNGYGGLSTDNIAQSGVPANNVDEKQNIASGSLTYFSRTPAPAGTSASLGGEFDDIIVWISPNILFNRMVAAGKLP
jgi:prepilin-type N-terminal cleavage/methylation domain-containing protein